MVYTYVVFSYELQEKKKKKNPSLSDEVWPGKTQNAKM